MSVRSEILDQFKQVADEQDMRLGPLSDDCRCWTPAWTRCVSPYLCRDRLEIVLGVDPFNARTQKLPSL